MVKLFARWTWSITSWLTAGNDECLKCGVKRKEHGKDHEFVEAT